VVASYEVLAIVGVTVTCANCSFYSNSQGCQKESDGARPVGNRRATLSPQMNPNNFNMGGNGWGTDIGEQIPKIIREPEQYARLCQIPRPSTFANFKIAKGGGRPARKRLSQARGATDSSHRSSRPRKEPQNPKVH
jgi:hypothetical protein